MATNSSDKIAALQIFGEWANTAVVITAASRVEDFLEAAIKSKMRPDLSSTVSNRLFKQYGPLKTFSGKIDIAYAFSIIDAETYNELRAIKDIRNRFAHANQFTNFNALEISVLVKKLSGWTAERDQLFVFLDRCKAIVDEKIKPFIRPEFPVAALIDPRRPNG